jgi:hypothetical protein
MGFLGGVGPNNVYIYVSKCQNYKIKKWGSWQNKTKQTNKQKQPTAFSNNNSPRTCLLRGPEEK